MTQLTSTVSLRNHSRIASCWAAATAASTPAVRDLGFAFDELRGVDDAGDGAGATNEIERLNRVEASFEQPPESHRGTTVDAHMAVHHGAAIGGPH